MMNLYDLFRKASIEGEISSFDTKGDMSLLLESGISAYDIYISIVKIQESKFRPCVSAYIEIPDFPRYERPKTLSTKMKLVQSSNVYETEEENVHFLTNTEALYSRMTLNSYSREEETIPLIGLAFSFHTRDFKNTIDYCKELEEGLKQTYENDIMVPTHECKLWSNYTAMINL